MRAATLLLALMLDTLVGDPTNRWHPVAWMGSAISTAQQHAPRKDARRQLVYGMLVSPGGAILAGFIGYCVERVCNIFPRPVALFLHALILKMMLSLGGLRRAAHEIETALTDQDLPEARRLVSWHLVSRDTSTLTETQVAAATIESVAENTSDSLVAPLFFYTIFGLPGAAAYRFANTADAMLGYRDLEREWLGKSPARFDDLLNLIPARLTAFLLVLATWMGGGDTNRAVAVWRRDRAKTASPNAGHPMSTAAGALDIELEKVDHYTLGAGGREPQCIDIKHMLDLAQIASFLAVGIFAVLSFLWQKAGHND